MKKRTLPPSLEPMRRRLNRQLIILALIQALGFAIYLFLMFGKPELPKPVRERLQPSQEVVKIPMEGLNYLPR